MIIRDTKVLGDDTKYFLFISKDALSSLGKFEHFDEG